MDDSTFFVGLDYHQASVQVCVENRSGEVLLNRHRRPGTPLEVLLLGTLGRWRLERLFEDSKKELGMDHFEVRKYPSIVRHLILTCISHLFLAEFWLTHRGKNPELTICQVRTVTRALVPVWICGGRCSRRRAESIAAQLGITQERNASALGSHRKRTSNRLHSIGIRLMNIRICRRTES